MFPCHGVTVNFGVVGKGDDSTKTGKDSNDHKARDIQQHSTRNTCWQNVHSIVLKRDKLCTLQRKNTQRLNYKNDPPRVCVLDCERIIEKVLTSSLWSRTAESSISARRAARPSCTSRGRTSARRCSKTWPAHADRDQNWNKTSPDQSPWQALVGVAFRYPAERKQANNLALPYLKNSIRSHLSFRSHTSWNPPILITPWNSCRRKKKRQYGTNVDRAYHWEIPEHLTTMQTAINPPRIMTDWNTSVHITAFMPPYVNKTNFNFTRKSACLATGQQNYLSGRQQS